MGGYKNNYELQFVFLFFNTGGVNSLDKAEVVTVEEVEGVVEGGVEEVVAVLKEQM